jgi:hypothetical protein
MSKEKDSSQEFRTGSRKRGRPESNGVKPGKILNRVVWVLCKCDEFRKTGMKRSSAITETVEFMRKEQPDLAVSETEVRRILAEFQPKGASEVLLVTSKPQEEVNREFALLPREIQDLLGNKPQINVMPIGFGPQPQYKRSNARE